MGAGSGEAIVKAPLNNHADKELIMLESLVGRIPPFVGGEYENYQGHGLVRGNETP